MDSACCSSETEDRDQNDVRIDYQYPDFNIEQFMDENEEDLESNDEEETNVRLVFLSFLLIYLRQEISGAMVVYNMECRNLR